MPDSSHRFTADNVVHLNEDGGVGAEDVPVLRFFFLNRTYCAIAERHGHLQCIASGGGRISSEHEIWNYSTNTEREKLQMETESVNRK